MIIIIEMIESTSPMCLFNFMVLVFMRLNHWCSDNCA